VLVPCDPTRCRNGCFLRQTWIEVGLAEALEVIDVVLIGVDGVNDDLEDKERSGTGAALTPQRRALEGMPPSAGRSGTTQRKRHTLDRMSGIGSHQPARHEKGSPEERRCLSAPAWNG
jgi:hypothetical protein